MVSKVLLKVFDRIFGKRFFKHMKRSQNDKTLKTQKKLSENAKPPSPRKSWLSRDFSRENAKPAVKFTTSGLRGLTVGLAYVQPTSMCDELLHR